MDCQNRTPTPDDLPFLREMLYEAVYWRSIATGNNPEFKEGLAAPGVGNALNNWSNREGDTGVIAIVDSKPAGAAWFRFYNEKNAIRGFIDNQTPVLVIAVHKDYRQLGLGKYLIEQLMERAATQHIQQISLMVSKDNIALALYQRCGFIPIADTGDSLLMTRQIV